jgi:hypothetical protein
MIKYLGNCLLITGLAWITSCNKIKEDEPLPDVPSPERSLNLSYTSDNGSFKLNEFIYTSQSGYAFSITRLSYYLSMIRLQKADCTFVLLKKYHYADASVKASNQIELPEIPEGNYIGITFYTGLDPEQNISNALPANTDNIEMQWPQPMGGGYHFLKLEGYYNDTSGTHGYALHLGRNICLRSVTLYKPFQVTHDKALRLELRMNVSEWFANPNTYDFNKDGNYIMGNDSAMNKVADNGMDVFNFIP